MGRKQDETKQELGSGHFIVWLVGQGEGCDYFIACNERLRCLSANSLKEANEEVAEIIGEYGEPDIEDAVIIKAERYHIFDIDKYNEEQKENKRAEKEAEKEKGERKLYLKLKKKFGE